MLNPDLKYKEIFKQIARNYVLANARLEKITDTMTDKNNAKLVLDCAAVYHAHKQWLLSQIKENWPDDYFDFCLELNELSTNF